MYRICLPTPLTAGRADDNTANPSNLQSSVMVVFSNENNHVIVSPVIQVIVVSSNENNHDAADRGRAELPLSPFFQGAPIAILWRKSGNILARILLTLWRNSGKAS